MAPGIMSLGKEGKVLREKQTVRWEENQDCVSSRKMSEQSAWRPSVIETESEETAMWR